MWQHMKGFTAFVMPGLKEAGELSQRGITMLNGAIWMEHFGTGRKEIMCIHDRSRQMDGTIHGWRKRNCASLSGTCQVTWRVTWASRPASDKGKTRDSDSYRLRLFSGRSSQGIQRLSLPKQWHGSLRTWRRTAFRI
jgi:hypothetical protein